MPEPETSAAPHTRVNDQPPQQHPASLYLQTHFLRHPVAVRYGPKGLVAKGVLEMFTPEFVMLSVVDPARKGMIVERIVIATPTILSIVADQTLQALAHPANGGKLRVEQDADQRKPN